MLDTVQLILNIIEVVLLVGVVVLITKDLRGGKEEEET